MPRIGRYRRPNTLHIIYYKLWAASVIIESFCAEGTFQETTITWHLSKGILVSRYVTLGRLKAYEILFRRAWKIIIVVQCLFNTSCSRHNINVIYNYIFYRESCLTKIRYVLCRVPHSQSPAGLVTLIVFLLSVYIVLGIFHEKKKPQYFDYALLHNNNAKDFAGLI